MPGYHRVDADTLHRASAGLFDSPCRCGRYGCPPCFNRHRILAHRMVQSIIRRQVDCAYALLATVEEWPRVQPVIRDHGAKYLRMRWTEGFFNTLVTAPVPGCGGPMDKLMAAVVAYETIRTAPRGHMPFLWHNQDFMEADQGPYGPQLV
jgi:hypothetical protein